jgi:cell wall-associated NlpC family hydrolase
MQAVTCQPVLLAVCLALACAACASSGAVPQPFPGASAPRPEPRGRPQPPPPQDLVSTPAVETIVPPIADPARARLVDTALGFRGTPYRNGGSDPSGFDCSGFVQYVFAQHATRLPREAYEQFLAGLAISLDEVQPGDLVFFETVARGPSHVGVAIGANQFVHAPSSNGVVRVERYTASYWSTRFIGARRIVTATSSIE